MLGQEFLPGRCTSDWSANVTTIIRQRAAGETP